MKPRKTIPPKLAERLLSWVCKAEYLEEIIGDLYEYHDEILEHSAWKRNLLYWFHTVNFLKPWALKSFSGGQTLNNYGMLKNYFKITWRSLLRQKLYSSINIGGLAIGLTCFILIFLYVQHERSYDHFYEGSENIYRIYKKNADYEYMGTNKQAYMTVGMAPELVSGFPEVVNATTIKGQSALISVGENHFHQEGMRADTAFFDVFGIELLRGNPQTALSVAESMVITESLAEKLFGEADPLGESVLFHNRWSFIVTGVMADLPTNSSLRYSFITPMLSSGQYTREINGDRWNNFDYYTFLRTAPGADPKALEAKFPQLIDTYHKDYPFQLSYHAQPIADLHLETEVNSDIGIKGNPQYVSLFSFIAVVVLLLACFNYMNLAIARSIKRAKEVGLRKVIGAVRRQLIFQFIMESVLISFLALLLALVLTSFTLPGFAHWLERPIELNLFQDRWLVPGLLLLTVIVGTVSGSYPALFMSSLKPVDVLKGKTSKKTSGMGLQKVLVIAQYATSIVLVVGSLVISRQFSYIQDKELGYDTDHVVVINMLDRKILEVMDELKAEWLRNPRILGVTATAELPTNVTSGTIARPEGTTKEEGIEIYRARVDHDYINVFDIELLTGRGFSPDISSDLETSRILNESAARAFGWTPEEAIGKQIREITPKTVIGVVKDFHMHSMHMEIGPLMLMMRDNWFAYMAVKVRPEQLTETLSFLEESVATHSPYPFEYKFLDDKFNELYRAETRLGELFSVFTILAIVIASLGLFGMAAFATGQRKKEIGIRKVLGASVQSITAILASDFVKLVLFGFILAIPIAWFAMDQWLADFAYRIDIEWWMFVLAGGTALVIALLTISSQSIKAALSNPVNCLQYE
ncbi:MAG: ABC transporter permease [Roseivirga sp.]